MKAKCGKKMYLAKMDIKELLQKAYLDCQELNSNVWEQEQELALHDKYDYAKVVNCCHILLARYKI